MPASRAVHFTFFTLNASHYDDATTIVSLSIPTFIYFWNAYRQQYHNTVTVLCDLQSRVLVSCHKVPRSVNAGRAKLFRVVLLVVGDVVCSSRISTAAIVDDAVATAAPSIMKRVNLLQLTSFVASYRCA